VAVSPLTARLREVSRLLHDGAAALGYNRTMTLVRPRPLVRLAPLAALAVFAACSGTNTPYYAQTSGPCTYENAQLALVSPAPGATAVPDAFTQVVLASSAVFPNTYDAVLTGNIGGVTQQVGFGNLIQTTLPTGAKPPSFANPIYYASTNPGVTFDAGTAVSVALNDTGSNCVPGAPIGTFTVQ